jgi:cysteine desulfurase
MDHAATTPVDAQVLEAMLPYFSSYYGNASSLHAFGREAHQAMDCARGHVAELISASSDEVVFTAGGTESDNLAIKGLAYRMREYITDYEGPHVITSSIEHPAVLETCKDLEREGFRVKYLPVDEYGLVHPDVLADTITDGTFLVSVMHANNEIGTVQDIAGLAKIAHERGALFHTDAVQTVGKIPVDVEKLEVDLLSVSAHKLYGPKGIGALYVRKGVKLHPLVHGGGHEKGLRSSTENIPGIVGFGKACELAKEWLPGDSARLGKLRDRLIENVLANIEQSYLNGHPQQRLPNNAHFRFAGIEGEALVLALDEKGIATSTGSACSSKKLEPSHVLLAIGLNEVEVQGSLRLTLGRQNTAEEVEYVCETLPEVVARLRELSPLWRKELELERWRAQIEKGRQRGKDVQ